jgi:hypothetical protein
MFLIFLSLLPLLALAKEYQRSPPLGWKTPTAPAHHSIPTIFLAGDSKMAPGGGGNGTEGWGQYLHYSFSNETVYINNSAIAGRSARSYTREGRFEYIAQALKPGDWVVIEFGTNDGGSSYLASKDNGRADCPGYGLYPGQRLSERKKADKLYKERKLVLLFMSKCLQTTETSEADQLSAAMRQKSSKHTLPISKTPHLSSSPKERRLFSLRQHRIIHGSLAITPMYQPTSPISPGTYSFAPSFLFL